MNVSRQTISKWETGVSVPDLDNAVRLCELLQIALNEFINGGEIEQDGKISLQDIVKMNKRMQKRTIILISVLFFLIIGVLAGLVIGALHSITGSIEYIFRVPLHTEGIIQEGSINGEVR